MYEKEWRGRFAKSRLDTLVVQERLLSQLLDTDEMLDSLIYDDVSRMREFVRDELVNRCVIRAKMYERESSGML